MTSDKSSWRYKRGGTDEATPMYDNLLTFFQTLKTHQNYEAFRVVCNDVATKVGFVPDLMAFFPFIDNLVDNSMVDIAPIL